MLQNKAIQERMGVLESVRRRWGQVVASVTLLGAAVFLFGHFRSPPAPNAYFSTDDGATWFVTPLQIPPFAYQGKEAVQAMLYTSDGGATKFVGYLLRYTAEGKLKMKARLGDPKAELVPIPPEWTEVKRPGAGSWTPGAALFSAEPQGRASGLKYSDIVTVTGPNRGPAVPVGAD